LLFFCFLLRMVFSFFSHDHVAAKLMHDFFQSFICCNLPITPIIRWFSSFVNDVTHKGSSLLFTIHPLISPHCHTGFYKEFPPLFMGNDMETLWTLRKTLRPL